MNNLGVTERTTPEVSAQRTVTTTVGGAFIVACAVVAALSMEVPDWVVKTDAPRPGWHYPPTMWPLLLALGAAGVAVMMRQRWARGASAVAAIVAAQIAGNGLIAIREWFFLSGLGGMRQHTIAALVTYAAVVALAATAGGVVAAAVAWREPAGGWRSLVPARPGYVAAGVAVVVLLPLMGDAMREGRDVTGWRYLGTLTYALPWGIGLAAAGWLRGRGADTVRVSVVVSAFVCTALIAAAHVITFYMMPPPGD